MSESSIELVCFDLGGVLLRIVDGWPMACDRAGVPLNDALLQPAQREAMHKASHAYETGQLTTEQFIGQIRARSDYTVEQVEAILDAWLIELYEGVDDLLSELADRGVRTALLSNTNAGHWATITGDRRRFEPLEQIGDLFASHLVGARKPDEAIYEHVERRLQVAAERILFFDDLAPNITGAVGRQWRTHHIDPTSETVPQIRGALAEHGVLA